MQDYIDMAMKNGVILTDNGSCQFCGAATARGIHECLEIFNLGFQGVDFSIKENHIFRFIIVDAHTLQHPEIHGRWNNHFHLLRQHLIFKYHVLWTYQLSPKLTDYLNEYKKLKADEFLTPPAVLTRGSITTTDVINNSKTVIDCKTIIVKWGKEVYHAWQMHHGLIDSIAEQFIQQNRKEVTIKELLIE